MPQELDLLVRVNNLKKHFISGGGLFSPNVSCVKAVDGVSFDISRGEVLGLVGESGCGKSTVARLILHLLEATDGEVIIDGHNLSSISHSELRKLRREMQIVFQDPYDSINPRHNLLEIIGEPLEIHGMNSRQEREEMVAELLETVGLSRACMWRYPHSFSGGQRQRIVIARAIALNPRFVVCDEPVSALDVSIQSQILNLLKKLKRDFNLTYLFISHDLSVIKHISDRVGVMYLGKMVELSPAEELFSDPAHPYTKALLSAIPVPNPKIARNRVVLKGDVPNPYDIPPGCRFHPRCPEATEQCSIEEPELKSIGGARLLSCFRCGL